MCSLDTAVQNITLLNLHQQQQQELLRLPRKYPYLYCLSSGRYTKAEKDELKEEIDVCTEETRLQREAVVIHVRAESTSSFLLKVAKVKVLIPPRI